MLVIWILPLAYVCYITFTAVRSYRRASIPGPWYTYVSSLVLKYHEITKGRRVWIHALHQRYGPVVRLAPNEVSFASLEGLKEIYMSGGSGYDKTDFYELFYQYDQRTMFSTMPKHDHAQRKRLFADRYAMTNVLRTDMLRGIEQRASYVVDICEASQGSHLDVYTILHCYALDGASHFLFNPGGTDSLSNLEDGKIMQELSYHDSIKHRYIQYYCPALAKWLSPFQDRPVSLAKQYVWDRTNAPGPAETSLISRLRSKSSPLSAIQSAAECMDHLAAGIDTTGDALCFLMYELSLPRSSKIQTRLRQELVCSSAAGLDELPYLEAVIKEGLRMFPPIPMSLPRYVPGPSGRNIAGYDVSAGTIVSCQPYSLHLLDPSFWGTGDLHPSRFNPDRWMDASRSVELNRMFFAFGAGGRGCIGRNLAMVEMKTLMKQVYTKFSTVVAKEMEADMSIDDQIIASRPKDQTCLLVFRSL